MVNGGVLTQTFTRNLYQTIYEEHHDTNRGINGPTFPRGLCGGGNANGGVFHRPNGVAMSCVSRARTQVAGGRRGSAYCRAVESGGGGEVEPNAESADSVSSCVSLLT